MADEFLKHFGVKGMKWGHHKIEGSSPRAEKKAAKANDKWQKKSSQKLVEVYNSTSARMNAHDIPKLNNKPAYRNADFSGDSPLRRKYYKEFEDAYAKVLAEESHKIIGESPDGSRKGVVVPDGNGGIVLKFYRRAEVKHADDSDAEELSLAIDAKGHILRVDTVSDDEVAHAELSHYGVKGMRWGVIQKRVLGNPAVSYVRPSEDHLKAQTVKIKAKVAGVHALSNKDLQTVIKRLDLETKYKDLKTVQHNQSLLGKGASVVGGILKETVIRGGSTWISRPSFFPGGGKAPTPTYTFKDNPKVIEGSVVRRAIGR